MTTFTTIPNSSLEPGKPIRSIDGLALRDNPIAIAEGASGAPKIQTAAIQDGAVTNAKIQDGSVSLGKFASGAVLAACAQASVGAVGTCGFFVVSIGSGSSISPGGTASGSSLSYAGVPLLNGSYSGAASGSPSGTWRLMGFSYFATGCDPVDARVSLWLRIS